MGADRAALRPLDARDRDAVAGPLGAGQAIEQAPLLGLERLLLLLAVVHEARGFRQSALGVFAEVRRACQHL